MLAVNPLISLGQLAANPQVQTLWQQARDGASVRTELMASYRYKRLLREQSYELKPEGATPPHTLD
jgi:hypothetical protein